MITFVGGAIGALPGSRRHRMKFDIATNDQIVDAINSFGEYKTYRQQCQDHLDTFGFSGEEARLAPFHLTLWEKARNADLLIKKAGIEGISADSWLWANAVKGHLSAGHLNYCNVAHIRSMLDEGVR